MAGFLTLRLSVCVPVNQISKKILNRSTSFLVEAFPVTQGGNHSIFKKIPPGVKGSTWVQKMYAMSHVTFYFSLCPHVTFYKTLTSLSTVFIKGHIGFLQLLTLKGQIQDHTDFDFERLIYLAKEPS